MCYTADTWVSSSEIEIVTELFHDVGWHCTDPPLPAVVCRMSVAEADVPELSVASAVWRGTVPERMDKPPQGQHGGQTGLGRTYLRFRH